MLRACTYGTPGIVSDVFNISEVFQCHNSACQGLTSSWATFGNKQVLLHKWCLCQLILVHQDWSQQHWTHRNTLFTSHGAREWFSVDVQDHSVQSMLSAPETHIFVLEDYPVNDRRFSEHDDWQNYLIPTSEAKRSEMWKPHHPHNWEKSSCQSWDTNAITGQNNAKYHACPRQNLAKPEFWQIIQHFKCNLWPNVSKMEPCWVGTVGQDEQDAN